MKPGELKIGDIVQIHPETPACYFRGCLMTCTEIHSWGAQGYFAMPHSRDEMPGLAFYRASWAEMEFVGHAAWLRAEPKESEESP